MSQKDPTINLQLPLSAVNYMLQALGQRPFGEVAGLIKDIGTQAEVQLKAEAEPKVSGEAVNVQAVVAQAVATNRAARRRKA